MKPGRNRAAVSIIPVTTAPGNGIQQLYAAGRKQRKS